MVPHVIDALQLPGRCAGVAPGGAVPGWVPDPGPAAGSGTGAAMSLDDPAEPGTDDGAVEAGGPLPAVPAGMARSGSARGEPRALPEAAGQHEQDELAAGSGMTPEKVTELRKHAREPVSLHLPLGEDGDSELGDLIEDSGAIQPGEAVSFILLQEQLHSVLCMLSEREAGVVSMRFGLAGGQPKTLDEIGKVYGVTRERIRQIESKTMSKLRHPSRSRLLRDYLD